MCSMRHCGTLVCCLRWRWEVLLLCFCVDFKFLYGSVGGWAENLFYCFLPSFATLFGCYLIHCGFKNRKSIKKIKYYKLWMAEKNYWWTERWIIFPLFFFSFFFFFFFSFSFFFSFFLFFSLFLSFYLCISFSFFLSLSPYLRTAKRKKLADRSGKYFLPSVLRSQIYRLFFSFFLKENIIFFLIFSFIISYNMFI